MKAELAVKTSQNESRSNRIFTLLEKLKLKTKNFIVLDQQGNLLGKAIDLVLDNKRQLNFLVIPDNKNRLFILPSKLINKIDVAKKSILANIDKSQFKSMPEYHDKEVITPDENLDKNGKSENIASEEIVKLLGERLIIDRSKRKIGEVIVRKEVEIQMVQVPVRREKLIVEQVTPEHKQLAEIDLGQQEISGVELRASESSQIDGFETGITVTGVFHSPKIASLLLNAIALERNHGCHLVQVTISVENEQQQQKYQQWFDRCSKDEES